jgi:nicotinamidase-related amidase
MSVGRLRFGPLERAVHISIDMQLLFAEGTEWASPAVREILPAVERLCAHAPGRLIFTRFITPETIEDAPGQWKQYYRRWKNVLASCLDPRTFDLLPELRRFTPAAPVVDKYVHSGFANPALEKELDRLDAAAVILTGVETDVCVLATALAAVDRGYRTVLVSDAIASSVGASHDACLKSVFSRYDEQIEIVDSATVLAEWTP